MAKRSAGMMKEADEAITHGTGNVFADLGYPDGEERQMKLRLAHAINSVIPRRRLREAAAAAKLEINRPNVSALANHKLDGLSGERLMTFLTALALPPGYGDRDPNDTTIAGRRADFGGGA